MILSNHLKLSNDYLRAAYNMFDALKLDFSNLTPLIYSNHVELIHELAMRCEIFFFFCSGAYSIYALTDHISH